MVVSADFTTDSYVQSFCFSLLPSLSPHSGTVENILANTNNTKIWPTPTEELIGSVPYNTGYPNAVVTKKPFLPYVFYVISSVSLASICLKIRPTNHQRPQCRRFYCLEGYSRTLPLPTPVQQPYHSVSNWAASIAYNQHGHKKHRRREE